MGGLGSGRKPKEVHKPISKTVRLTIEQHEKLRIGAHLLGLKHSTYLGMLLDQDETLALASLSKEVTELKTKLAESLRKQENLNAELREILKEVETLAKRLGR